MGIRYRVVKPCVIKTYVDQPMAEHYRIGDRIKIDDELHVRNEKGQLVLPGKGAARCLTRIDSAKPLAADDDTSPHEEQTDESRVIMIRRAVGRLEDGNDDHWTRQRTPAVHAVNEFAGFPDPPIRAADIKTVCPDVVRGMGRRMR